MKKDLSYDAEFNKPFLFIGFILLFVFPQLNNVHYDPQPQFWAEMTAAWIAIGIFTFIIIRFDKITIPFSIIPLSLFAIYLTLQPSVMQHIDFIGLNYVAALEMVIGILLAISVNTIRNTYGMKYLVTVLAYALVTGAILQSIIGIIQYTGSAKLFGDMIFYDSSHPTTNIFGHFGQRNHYAHYLTWGTLGLIYLFQQQRINYKMFYPLLVWLCFSLTISASRSVLIYFPLASIISVIAYLTNRNKQTKQLMLLIIIATAALFTIEYMLPIINKLFAAHNSSTSGLSRLSSNGGNETGRRSIEWQKAWIVFKDHPLLGVGWNGFAKQSVLLYPLFPNAELNSGLFTNCHNLILQLLAETGLVGTLIVVIGLIGAVLRQTIKNLNSETIIILCMLGTTLAHSMNEYPLWYVYFLVGLVTFISLDKPLVTLSTKFITLVSIIPLAYLVYLMIRGSMIFDTLVDYYDTPDDQKTYNTQAHYLEKLVNNNALWSYYSLYTLDNYINVDDEMTDDLMSIQQQYYYTNKLATFHPYPDTMLKQAMLDFNLGNESAAESLVKLDVLAFPVYKASFRDSLKDPYYHKLYALTK
ncbi:MAG: hypothetical protein EKK57_09375 [Proteobacteria bacterium]|nr:MAG: hypothetical protein EKK57_09375 [Pseudomonadota bacterium]